MPMKKIFMTIPYFLLWILYFFITMNDRVNYQQGLSRGMHVEKSEDVSWLIPGSTTEYTYNPNKKPERNYITWREFWVSKGYFKK
jgi:hypothetical protein